MTHSMVSSLVINSYGESLVQPVTSYYMERYHGHYNTIHLLCTHPTLEKKAYTKRVNILEIKGV